MMLDGYLKILLVDPDEEDYILTREMLNEVLMKKYELHWASSFDVGEQELKAGQYDAVLIEYELGLRSGLELIRDATTKNYTAPFILYSDRGRKEVELEAIQSGATLYLPKLELRIFETQGSVEVEELPAIEVDPIQIRQLFQNLIGNALKFHYCEITHKIFRVI